MPNKFDAELVEPEEKVDFIDINPLDEPVNEKRYAQPNISASTEDLNKPIAEPSFAPPPLQRPTIPVTEQPKREPINPEMKSLPKKDTEMAASHAAKLIIQGYEWIHDLGNKALKVSEKKLVKLQAEGEINLSAMIDYDYGKKISAGEFFKEYNNQVGDVLKVSDEFKEEVTPVLERVLAKRGVGMTDEQLLMFMFGKDIAAKSMIFFQQKQQLNFMIQSIKEATAGQFVQQMPTPEPEPQPEPTPQPRQQQPRKENVPDEDDFSVVEETYTTSSRPNEGKGTKPDIIVLPKKRRGRPTK